MGGREVRRVPLNWEHPKTLHGGLKPLHPAADYEQAVESWEAYYKAHGLQKTLDEHGQPPNRDDYMPEWSPEGAAAFRMYETTSEGTPISPAFGTVEELCRWLADTKASMFGNSTAPYELWMQVCRAGSASTFLVRTPTQMETLVVMDQTSQ